MPLLGEEGAFPRSGTKPFGNWWRNGGRSYCQGAWVGSRASTCEDHMATKMEDCFLMLGMMRSWFHVFSYAICLVLSFRYSCARTPFNFFIMSSGLRVSGTFQLSSQQQRTQPIWVDWNGDGHKWNRALGWYCDEAICHPNPLLKNTCLALLFWDYSEGWCLTVCNCILCTREGGFVCHLFQPAPTYISLYHILFRPWNLEIVWIRILPVLHGFWR